MRTTLTALLATTAMALSTGAYATDASYKAETEIDKGDHGSYEKTTKVVSDSDDTRVATEVNVDKDVDEDGDMTKTTTIEKTRDPQGLFNKETEKLKESVKREDGEVTVETKHTVNGETVKDTKTTR